MKTSVKRFQEVISFVFNPTIVLLLGIYLSSFLVLKPIPKANLKIIDYSSNNRHHKIMFEPGLDLSTQFDFNVKQIFTYLKVIYPEHKNTSEIVWSSIVGRKSEKKLFSRLSSNYKIVGNLAEKKIFELRGNYFPYVGVIKDVVFARIEADI